MYIGRDFKRDIELDSLNEYDRYLRPNRSWLDLFSLSLSFDFRYNKFNFSTLTDNLTEDEVIIIGPHDDIFKFSQIHYWRKDRISDILPAIKCPSFKSENEIFKTSEMDEMRRFIKDQDDIKYIVIEKADKNLSVSLVYGDTEKITPLTFYSLQHDKLLDKLKERYELWEIDDCACKPKKIRVLADDFEKLKYAIGELESISNTNDVKLGVYIDSEHYTRYFFFYDTIVFNHSSRWMNDNYTNFIFTGNTLMVVYRGNSYNFRLDQRTKKSKHSYIKGKI